ncbi:phage replisome organizer N-terminal domain-containing protein [Clostridium sp.]|uniref:phage replisome organizer N-terminal domain-containing protein n=1 Tax=Clostridium sp. TaxID=1506 RepID=UPI002844B789|nr:phage replisome organizer N-terminal domain-containing protein [Clostridium sp.]MDR3593416.1 phage replisome organizer N-terminal domain-containing protein [Clostridium sp.]
MNDILWLKLYTGIFENEKLKLIESMEMRDVIVCLLIKLYIQAAKTNDRGLIYLNKNTPYTNEMLSIILNRPVNAIEAAFKILSDFQLIEIDEDNFIRICNWEKYQNVESMERARALTRDRVRNYRAKKKENSSEVSHAKKCNVTVTEQRENKIEKKNEIKNKSKIEIKSEENSLEKNDLHSNKINDYTHEVSVEKNDSKSLSPALKKQEIEEAANELLDFYKKNSIKVSGLNLPVLKNCIPIHGKDNVKFAIDKGLELNKPNMKYINGILKNWIREGYPALGDSENIPKAGEAKILRFNNFKPREYDYESLEKALLGWDKS